MAEHDKLEEKITACESAVSQELIARGLGELIANNRSDLQLTKEEATEEDRFVDSAIAAAKPSCEGLEAGVVWGALGKIDQQQGTVSITPFHFVEAYPEGSPNTPKQPPRLNKGEIEL